MWRSLRQFFWPWRGLLIAAPSATLLVVVLRSLGVLQGLEWMAYDWLMRQRPPEPVDPRIVIVGIYETDIQRYGHPFSDAQLADLLRRIQAQNPRAIGLDLYRDQPVGEGYAALAEVFRSNPNLIGIRKVVGYYQEPVPPPPILAEQGQVGANDVVVDADGRLRRAVLSLTDADGETVLGFGLLLSLVYLEGEGIFPELTEEGWIRVKNQVFAPFLAEDGGYVAADDQGYQLLINYRVPPFSFRRVSVAQVLDGEVSAELFRDRIVLVGSMAESSRDFFLTPQSVESGRLPVPMAGVEIHANIISQLLSTTLEGRSLIQSWAEPWEWLWVAAWSLLGAALAWQQRHPSLRSPRWQTWPSWVQQILGLGRVAGSVAVAVGLLTGVCLVALVQGWWIPFVPPLLSLVGGAIATTLYLGKSSVDLRRTFGRYLSDEVVFTLLETPQGLNLGGDRRCITILMSDLRGFTSISEHLSPEQVVTLLNLYLSRMTDIINHYGGVINDVIGDGLVVFFGVPTAYEDHVERAIACALAMQMAMDDVNLANQDRGLPAVEMGIGINTGEVIVGNIGSQQHMKYTAIGSHVNLASRIESSSVGGQILISQDTCKQCRVPLTIKQRRQIDLKGISDPIWVFDILGMDKPYNLSIARQQATAMVDLSQPIPVHYILLDGKRVTGLSHTGHLLRLSSQSAELQCETAIAPLSNLRLTLLSHDNPTLEDCYAKIIDHDPADPLRARLHFTSLSPHLKAVIQSLISPT